MQALNKHSIWSRPDTNTLCIFPLGLAIHTHPQGSELQLRSSLTLHAKNIGRSADNTGASGIAAVILFTLTSKMQSQWRV